MLRLNAARRVTPYCQSAMVYAMPVTFIGQQELDVNTLKPHPENPNRGDVKALASSLEEFGQYRSIVANKDGTILAGHHVWEAAKKLGLKTIRADVVDADEQEARKILLADNRLADLGLGPDLDLLLDALNKVEDLQGTGFDDEYIAMLEEATAGAPELDDLEDDEPQPKPQEFYRRLSITVDPKLVTRWEEHKEGFEDDNHAFAALLGVAEDELDDPEDADDDE